MSATQALYNYFRVRNSSAQIALVLASRMTFTQHKVPQDPPMSDSHFPPFEIRLPMLAQPIVARSPLTQVH